MLGYIKWGSLAKWALQGTIGAADKVERNRQGTIYKDNWWDMATQLWEGQSVFQVAAEYEARYGIARTFTIIQASNILRIFALNRSSEAARRQVVTV